MFSRPRLEKNGVYPRNYLKDLGRTGNMSSLEISDTTNLLAG
jgi:hypothetical protein